MLQQLDLDMFGLADIFTSGEELEVAGCMLYGNNRK